MKQNQIFNFRILFLSAIFFVSLSSYGQKNFSQFEEIYKQKVLHEDLFSKMNTSFDSIGIKPQI